jgi:RNA polymerase sigma-70 factor (ECF subfamily)
MEPEPNCQPPSAIPPEDESQVQSWVSAAQGGDEGAYKRLVENFAVRLQALVYRMVLDWDEARDVAQEAFIRAFRALPRYRPDARFQAWLFQIGARCALDALRSRKRHPDRAAVSDAAGENILARQGQADRTVERNELMRAIEAAVGKLPPEQRAAFVMAEYEGFSHAEIGEVLDVSAKSVESHIYRARQTLRDELEEYLRG